VNLVAMQKACATMLLAALACCGSDATPPHTSTQQTESAAHATQDGFFVAPGAPAPRSCNADEECVGDTIPDATNPCCNDPRSLRAYGREYKRWVNGWREANCDGVTCPPPPSPSIPPDCAFQVRCERNQCVDSCP